MLFCCLLIYFKINFFEKFFQDYHQCQTVWIQIRPDIMSGLIWIQTICKGYHQMTQTGNELSHNNINFKKRFHQQNHFLSQKWCSYYVSKIFNLLKVQYFMYLSMLFDGMLSHMYSLICLKGPLKNRQNKYLNDKW